MFPIIINDGQTEFPKDDIFYIISKEGIFLKKKLGVMESIAPVKNISILKNIIPMSKMHIEKLPGKLCQQIINFFKEVYKEHSSEAIIILFYNNDIKKYKLVCPQQEVSTASIDYVKGITIKNYDMIGTIHSHASMSAFHSGVDDKDEETFDGLHITFGDMKSDDISISASIVSNGFRNIVNPHDYIDNLKKTIDIDENVKVKASKIWRWDNDLQKMIEVQNNSYSTKRIYDQRYKIMLSYDVKIPKTWMNKVTKGESYYGGYYGGGWKDWKGHNTIKTNTTNSIKKNLPSTIIFKNDTKKIDVKEEKASPCNECSFKNHKISTALETLDADTKQQIIKWALNEYEEDADSVLNKSIGEDEIELTHYECIACNLLFSIDESEGVGVCPTCKTDDYIIEVTASEVLMGDDDKEDDKDVITNYLTCKSCDCTFTKDFLEDGGCPICGTVLVSNSPEEENTMCPECHNAIETEFIKYDSQCPFCRYDFDTLKNTTTKETKKDSGPYLNTDTEDIEKIVEAGHDVKHIPIPEKKSKNIFSRIFKKEKLQ